ncbi:MAG TPA: DUF2141 domain-containing protein [Novosphingobium sp.]|jgi:uncharacterized protein (DUF2141 family)|nr:DUF2141 domain-containing protein [Novosphingobium sp.]HPB23564.1 DUF2141 domain-containing protein [Novosphingobium sp.]HPZ47416.1 DUF2141 domain-containing protein [Novosphingobium sp.]HQD99766.1 DUF2141 domain-containing protein [Novosphingobium sp.]HQQ09752.1 DUF2141 domain-containing protein [Novosphingobium sp.]
MSRLALFALTAVLCSSTLPAETPAPSSLEIVVTGAKSNKGLIRVAVCPAQAGFPDCGSKAVRTVSVPLSAGGARVVLGGLAPGNYAVSLFHDANANGKLDTFAGIPREGYGFSRNPPFRPRAPRFDEAEIAVSGETRAAIGLRYIL